MNRGKHKCKILKDIRRRIAEANGIPSLSHLTAARQGKMMAEDK